MKTPVLYQGYMDWVEPWRIGDGSQYYMLGDHGPYCPVRFR